MLMSLSTEGREGEGRGRRTDGQVLQMLLFVTSQGSALCTVNTKLGQSWEKNVGVFSGKCGFKLVMSTRASREVFAKLGNEPMQKHDIRESLALQMADPFYRGPVNLSHNSLILQEVIEPPDTGHCRLHVPVQYATTWQQSDSNPDPSPSSNPPQGHSVEIAADKQLASPEWRLIS